MLADIDAQQQIADTSPVPVPSIDEWMLQRNKNGVWDLDAQTLTDKKQNQLSAHKLLDVIAHFHLDQLPVDQSGVTFFDEKSGQTYRLVRCAQDQIRLSQTNTTTYLQQYLAEREALFSQSQKISVGEMATTLAHEINQPIGAVQNLLQGIDVRLRKENTDLDEIRQVVGRAIEQTQFASRIVARIRDFTQAREPRYEVLSVQSLLEESSRLLDWVFSTRSIKLKVDCAPHLRVHGDYTMLQQVVTNLLRNGIEAIEASERSGAGEIRVTATLEEDRVRIQIRDNGIGIKNTDQLFTPFATSKPDGMGVGLNICRSFIELHNGRLWLSPADGAGSIGNIQLPYIGEDNAR